MIGVDQAPIAARSHPQRQLLTVRILTMFVAVLGVFMSARAQSVAWTQRTVSGPSARSAHAMAYDSSRGVTVLFGGKNGASIENGETWEWNGSAWTQRLVSGPSPRYNHAMAYDSARGVTVLFGGSAGGYDGQTWEWNGTTWTQRGVSGPPGRAGHAMAFDSARGVTVLFGGVLGLYSGQTWEWNGTVWTQRAVSGPSARAYHAMAYDAARGVTVLYGGADPSVAFGDTWEWNGTAWAQRASSGSPARKQFGMVHDGARAKTVLFGGLAPGVRNDETWEWNSTIWTRQVISGPAARYAHAMVFDELRQVVVLFGGDAINPVNTNAETWELCTAASIATQPADQAACVGGAATILVTAAGSGPRTYQWQRETTQLPGTWVNITDGPSPGVGDFSGAATLSLAVSNVTSSAAGRYRCIATNACSSATSDPATLTIYTPPSITTHPVPVSACPGGSATFSVAASGSPSPTFQWRKDSVDIAGATSASFSISSVTAGDAGSYDCVVANTCGTATSSAATLTVYVEPLITTHPLPVSACPGGSATFSVAASGLPSPTFQWRKDSIDIAGATSPSYSISSVTAGDAGSYDCVVANTCGTATSGAATLTVYVGPLITTHPVPVLACPGGAATFSVAASGLPSPTFQWRKDSVDIAGATSPWYSIGLVTAGDAGSYDCVVANACATATSGAAMLTVYVGPSITTHPVPVSACPGGAATFSVAASGLPSPTFQWRKDSVDIAGANSASYSIGSVTAGEAGSYDCVVANTCGTATSGAATLTVHVGPSITTHPVPVTACPGGSATFSVAASGSPAPTFQWRKDSVDIAGATSASYSISLVTAGDAGSYDCVVANTCGTATSTAATLVVNPQPIISQQPLSVTICTSGIAIFTVIDADTESITHEWQWKKGTGTWTAMVEGLNSDSAGQPQFDATGTSSNSITTDPPAADTTYPVITWDVPISVRCLITDACGTVASDEASRVICAADFNCDGQITPADVAAFVSIWSASLASGSLVGDFDGNGVVAPADVGAFVSAWFAAVTSGC